MPYARNGDVRIHYVVEGSGPPLVLHHGFTGSGRDWETFGFVDGLRDTFQLIMLDARGHGASDKPHAPAAYGFAHGAGDVVAVLNELGLAQAHYYGYSYGGAMGWALGWYAPERFASLAIGGAHPFPPAAEVWQRFDEMRCYLAWVWTRTLPGGRDSQDAGRPPFGSACSATTPQRWRHLSRRILIRTAPSTLTKRFDA